MCLGMFRGFPSPHYTMILSILARDGQQKCQRYAFNFSRYREIMLDLLQMIWLSVWDEYFVLLLLYKKMFLCFKTSKYLQPFLFVTYRIV